MPSYQERSQIAKDLSEQQYYAALKARSTNKDVQIGSAKGDTGRYEVYNADGGITSNGIKTFNAASPNDGFVRGIRGSNSIALDHKNIKQAVVRQKNLETPTISTPIKFLQSKEGTDYSEIYLGGDRQDPELIFTAIDGYSVGNTLDEFIFPTITTLGTNNDDWIVQVVSTKTELLDAIGTNTLVDLFIHHPEKFQKFQVLSTITQSGQVDIYSDGVALADGTVFTGQNSISVSIIFSEYQSGVLTNLAILATVDTYTATANPNNLWTYSRTNRVITRTNIGTPLNPTDFNAAMTSATAILNANSLNVLDWQNATDIGIPPLFDGYTTNTDQYLLFADGAQNEIIRGKINNIISKSGWWFSTASIYSKNADKWIEAYASFNNSVSFDKTTFSTITQTNTISLQLNSINSDSVSVTPASFVAKTVNKNININAPVPSVGYNSLYLIQGWQQQSQLVKVLGDWRLYLVDGSYTVVEIPTYLGVSLLSGLENGFDATRVRIDLVNDCLFKILNSSFLDTQALIVGAKLTDTPFDITTAKVLTCYPQSLTLGQTDSASLYLTIDDYDALDDYAP